VEGAGPGTGPWARLLGQVWRCARCETAFGVVHEGALIVGMLAIEEPVRLRCMACGHHQRWRPRQQQGAAAQPEERAHGLKTLG
jgi:DNA-directed RNA polymerase subunit RPC12/RpoP